MGRMLRDFSTYGNGVVALQDFAEVGRAITLEAGVLVFHPESIRLGSNIYVGHYTILNGYHSGSLTIGDNTWVGPQCFFHGAGNLYIGRNVGIGAGVKIITSVHTDEGRNTPVLWSDIVTAPVRIEDDCDVGIGAIILPGVVIGKGSIVGAGAVVTRSVDPFSVVAGVPAKVLRIRD